MTLVCDYQADTLMLKNSVLVSRVSDGTEAAAILKQKQQQQEKEIATATTVAASAARQLKEREAELESEKKLRVAAEGNVGARTRDALQQLDVQLCNVRNLETQSQVNTTLSAPRSLLLTSMLLTSLLLTSLLPPYCSPLTAPHLTAPHSTTISNTSTVLQRSLTLPPLCCTGG